MICRFYFAQPFLFLCSACIIEAKFKHFLTFIPLKFLEDQFRRKKKLLTMVEILNDKTF